MRVILTQTIESLGIIGSEVEVKPGYARNYLLPQKKAVTATPENRHRLEQEKAKFELQIAKERQMAEEMARRLAGVSCKIAAKVAEENRLYGSVGVREIIDALAAQNIGVEKRMVLLTEPIKELGSFQVPIRVYKGIEPEITVEVVAEG
ncbi:MAG: 50S ribosomal protein L9 [Desulfobacterales bacterium]|jgi:large subunit ribosomal protein L9|nr:50S ribosomal protein L9 [Desulfobacterales bacterium]MCU0585501.1 50S ribosomal protein L9 [Desulfobacterales bacterium]